MKKNGGLLKMHQNDSQQHPFLMKKKTNGHWFGIIHFEQCQTNRWDGDVKREI